LRTRFGLSPFSWTDPSLSAGVLVKVIHVADLRTALEQAYDAAGQSAPVFTDPSLIPQTTTIRAIHISELRGAVLALEAR
jgi:hypothetical protein